MSLRRYTLPVLFSVLAACSDDPGSSEDVGTDPSVDTADVGPDTDVATDIPETDPDVAPDADADVAPDTEEVDVDPGPCPGAISCIDEISGNPSLRVCTEAGYPTGTICERQSESVACCVPPFSCTTDADCEAARATEEFCLDSRFPCVCNGATGQCGIGLCSSDAECDAGEACAGGVCAPAPDAAGYVARILTPPGYIADGETIALVAVAVDPADPTHVHPDAEITWAIEAGDGATVSATGALTGSTTPGATTVIARVADNASDPGDTVVFTNIEDPSAGPRVVVVDADTRAPLEGALVVSGDEEVSTDATGVAELAATPSGAVSVFAAGHSYATVLGAGAGAILVPLPADQQAIVNEIRDGFVCTASSDTVVATEETDDCGGADQPFCLCYELENVDAVKGSPDFAGIPDTGDLAVSISGFSLGASLLDVNFDLIVGPSLQRVFPDGSPLPLDDTVEIPSGVTLQFNGQRLIDNYVLTSGAGDRSVWSIGGVVPLSTVLLDILPNLSGNLDIGSIIAAILPFFDEFYSGVSAPIPLSASGTFPVRDPQVALDVPTQRRVFVEVPQLPALATGFTDTAIVLGGALIPGEGFVPLGITGGSDDVSAASADGFVDGDLEAAGIQPLRISMAPAHGPAAAPTSQYAFAHVALMLGDRADAPREAAAGIITRLPVGASLEGTYTTGGTDFPPIPLGTAWDAATRTLTLDGDLAYDFVRVVFKDDVGHAWVVYAPGDATSITIPDVPATFAGSDRAARGRLNVVGVNLVDGAPDYAGLLAVNGASFSDIFEFLSSFAVIGL
ncbi:MAG: hypothetical protein H6700_10130 [Myxococcales bacterium]|nr:hypothetical protein [Myxococcales bacterium]MCB9520707.1 hypothetical protein [Myxococcales bacterium]MCB9532111.1 hypothetical protein [Myxococcales bacterium]